MSTLLGVIARQLSVQWNKAVRRTLPIPYATHTRLLPLILNTSSFMDQHARRVQKFISAFLTAQNDNVSLIGSRTRDFRTGTLGRNQAQIKSRQQITLPHEIYVCHPATEEPPDQLADVERVQELLDACDGVVELNICFMTEHICCA